MTPLDWIVGLAGVVMAVGGFIFAALVFFKTVMWAGPNPEETKVFIRWVFPLMAIAIVGLLLAIIGFN